MADATKDRLTPQRVMELKVYSMAKTNSIYKGTLVSINAAGYAVKGADTAAHICVGVADETVISPSTDANGDKTVRVRSGRAFELEGSGLTRATVGDEVYIADNQTVELAAAATNDIIAGILVEYISATKGWVYIPEGGSKMMTQ